MRCSDVPARLQRYQWVNLFEPHAFESLLESLRARAIELRIAVPDERTRLTEKAIYDSLIDSFATWTLYSEGGRFEKIKPVEAVAVTTNSKHVVLGSADGTVRVWGLETGEHLRTLIGHSEAVKVLIMMPDDNHVISGSWDYTLRLWNLSTGNEPRSISDITSYLALTLTRDGTRLICGSQDGDGILRVWNLVTGDVQPIFTNHESHITAVAVTPDGKYVFSGCLEGKLVLSELTTGKTLHTVAAHSSAINKLVVIDHGNRLISVSYDKTVKLWDLETWESLSFTAEAEFGNCCVVLDGPTIVVGDYSGTVHFLRV